MQLQVTYREYRYSVECTVFFWHWQIGSMIFIIQFQKAKPLEEKKWRSKKRLQFTQWKSKTPGAEERQTAFRFLVHFLCKNRSSISTKNLPPHWEWQQQHSCCSRERTEQGRLSGVVTATSTTRDTSKLTLLAENEHSLQWYNVYNFKFNSLIILIRQLPYQENMSETKMCSTEYICWNWS